MIDLRQKVAKAAREMYSGGITFEQFIDLTPDQDNDELIDELVYLIEHEPQKGGVLGVKEKDHESYMQQIFKVIEKLESHAT